MHSLLDVAPKVPLSGYKNSTKATRYFNGDLGVDIFGLYWKNDETRDLMHNMENKDLQQANTHSGLIE